MIRLYSPVNKISINSDLGLFDDKTFVFIKEYISPTEFYIKTKYNKYLSYTLVSNYNNTLSISLNIKNFQSIKFYYTDRLSTFLDTEYNIVLSDDYKLTLIPYYFKTNYYITIIDELEYNMNMLKL